jgi:hypothetical protein
LRYTIVHSLAALTPWRSLGEIRLASQSKHRARLRCSPTLAPWLAQCRRYRSRSTASGPVRCLSRAGLRRRRVSNMARLRSGGACQRTLTSMLRQPRDLPRKRPRDDRAATYFLPQQFARYVVDHIPRAIIGPTACRW